MHMICKGQFSRIKDQASSAGNQFYSLALRSHSASLPGFASSRYGDRTRQTALPQCHDARRRGHLRLCSLSQKFVDAPWRAVVETRRPKHPFTRWAIYLKGVSSMNTRPVLQVQVANGARQSETAFGPKVLSPSDLSEVVGGIMNNPLFRGSDQSIPVFQST
jgi:hypothetical protein